MLSHLFLRARCSLRSALARCFAARVDRWVLSGAFGPFASAAGIGTTRLPAGDLGVPASDLDDSPVNGPWSTRPPDLLEEDSRSLSWLGPPLNSLVAADPYAACDRRLFAVRGECWR